MSVTPAAIKTVLDNARFPELVYILTKADQQSYATKLAMTIARRDGIDIAAVRAAVRFVRSTGKEAGLMRLYLKQDRRSAFEVMCEAREQLKREDNVIPATPEQLELDALYFAGAK